MPYSTPARLALFGAGRIGQVHARNISASPEAELVIIVDPFVQGAELLAAGTGSEVAEDPQVVFDRDDVDGIVIASPTSTHVDLITRAVARDLAVLCEKPIDLDIGAVRACQHDLGGRSSKIMLGFNRRFDPSFAAVRNRVAAGEVGSLEQLIITSRDPEPAPRAYIAGSGGIFRDMTIHDLDMARFFIPEITEVSASGSNSFSKDIAELDDFDSTVVTMRGSSDELVTIINSRHCAYGYDQRLEAFGSEGMLSASNLGQTTVKKFTNSATEQADPHLPFFLERYTAAYRAELESFIRGIRNDEQFSPSFEDGVAALELANAAAESVATGKTVPVASTSAPRAD